MSEINPRPVSNGEFEPFDADEFDIEVKASDANEADFADQHRLAGDADQPSYRYALRDDVDPADAADQYREVGLDEDDYYR